MRGKALSLEPHGLPTRSHGDGDLPVFVPLDGQQDHLCTQGQADGGAPSPDLLLQLCAFIVRHLKLRSSSLEHPLLCGGDSHGS